MNKIKTKFCLRTRNSLDEIPLLVCIIALAIPMGCTIYTRNLKIFLIIIIPLVIFILIGLFLSRKWIKERLYIDGSNIYVDGWCSYKIDPQKIKGIKIMHMYTVVDNTYYPKYYKDGTPIYLMIMLSEIEVGMYNFRYNERRFAECFGEYMINEAEYNPDAIRHLKTLNPDIKVFY